MSKDYRGLIKYVLNNNDIEEYTAEEYGFGEYFFFDIDNFMYDGYTKKELNMDEAEDWMEERIQDIIKEHKHEGQYVVRIEDIVIACQPEDKKIIDIILGASSEV